MRKLGRKKSNREHLIRNQAASLILYETMDTTISKAKETKTFLEKLISRCKSGDLSAIRKSDANLFDKNASKKLIIELLPRYKDRKSGYIRSYHLKNRLGDNSQIMRLELVDKKIFSKEANIETKNKTKNDSKIKTKPENVIEKKVKKEKKDDLK